MKEDHPHIRRIAGERMSGSRYKASGATEAEIEV